MTFGQRMRSRREALSISPEQMADKIGVSRPTVVRYELDTKTPPLMVAKSIAEVLGVTVDDLLNGGPI